MHRIFLLALLAVTAPGVLRAQTARRAHRSVPHPAADSITLIADAYAHRLDSLSRGAQTPADDSDDVLENPYYFPLFAGNTLYDAQLHTALGSFSESRRKFPERFRALCLTFMGTAPTSFRVFCRLLL